MSKKLIRSEKVVDTKIDDEVVMMNADRGHYFGLDDVGTVIWEMLEEPMTHEELVEQLTQRFDVSVEQCKKDIAPFIRNLLRTGMLVETEE